MPARGLHQLQQSAGYRHQRWVGGADPAGLLADGRLAHRHPNVEGMDPAVLDELDTKVPDRYPRCAACWWCATATWSMSATGTALTPAMATTATR
jgi:hypothetical protein